MAALVTVIAVNAVFVVIAIPLMLRRVPPNVVYGYRTRATLTNEKIWYEANAHFGRGLLIASAVSCIAACAVYLMHPQEQYIPLTVILFVTPSLLAALATARYIRRLRA